MNKAMGTTLTIIESDLKHKSIDKSRRKVIKVSKEKDTPPVSDC